MIRTVEESGRWIAFREENGRRTGLAGYGSSEKKALRDYNEQANVRVKEPKSRW